MLNATLGQVMAAIKKLWALLGYFARLSVITYSVWEFVFSLFMFPLASSLHSNLILQEKK